MKNLFKIEGNTIKGLTPNGIEYIKKNGTIPFPSKNIYTIGKGAFANTALKRITIPNSVVIIEEYAFDGCTSIEEFTVEEGIFQIINLGYKALPTGSPWYNRWIESQPNGVVYFGKVAYTIKGQPFTSRVFIKNGTSRLCEALFKDCTWLKGVYIPKSVKAIGSRVFENCTNLKEIVIPDSVVMLGNDDCKGGVFKGCTKLERVAIGSKLTYIERNTFADCTSLKYISIPKNVVEICDNAFENCTNLVTVELNNKRTVISTTAFKNCGSVNVVQKVNNVDKEVMSMLLA